MKNINIEEVKRYLKRSLKKKVKITTSLIVLFMMSNSIVSMAAYVTIDNGKIGEYGAKNDYKPGAIALNPKGEGDSKPQKEKVKDYSIAIGLGSEADNSNSVSIGHSSKGNASESVAIGHESVVEDTAKNAIAIGTKAKAYIQKSVSIGEGAETVSVNFYNNGSRDENNKKNAEDGQATAIGSGAVAVDQATSVGNDTYAIGRSSIAIGSDDNKKFREETTTYDFNKYFKNLYDKIGNSDGHKYGAKNGSFTQFKENDFSYNYSPTLSAGEGGIAIGTRALSYGTGATSIGAMSFALGNYSTAMGAKTRAEGEGAIAIGNSTKVFSAHSVAVGNENQILKDGGTAYGYKAYSGGENSIAIGTEVYSNTILSDDTKGIHGDFKGKYTGEDNGTLFGNDYMTRGINDVLTNKESKLSESGSLSVSKKELHNIKNIIEGKNKNSIVLGTKSMVTGSNSIALGHGTFSLSENSMAFGSFSYVKGDNSLGLGVDSKILSGNSIAIGTRAGVGYDSANSLVMGNFSYSTGKNALVFGNKSKVTAEDGLAIGSNSEASLPNSTALGVNSKTDYTKEDLEKDAYAPRGVLSMPSTEKIGVISVGSKGAERRIVNVAAGYRDTDAVNVSQLKAMEEKINQSGLMDVEDDDLNISDNGIHYLSVDKNGYRSKDIKEIMQKQRDYNKYIEYKSRQLEMKAREARGDKLPDPYKTKINAKVENLEKKYKNDTQFNQIELKKITDQKIDEIKNNGASFDAIITEINLAKEKDKYITYTDENGQEIQKLKTILYEDEVKKINESNYNNKGAIGKDSIALGYQTKSTGDKGIAIGTGDQRSLDILEKQAILDASRGEEKQKLVNKEIGLNNNMYTRSGENAVAVGTGAIAKDWSVALGGNTQTEDTAVAIGDRSKALGNRSIAIGNKAATGRYYEFNGKEKINETLKKSNLKTLNYDSIGLVGYDGAEKAIAIGSHSTATSDYSVAIGNGATTGDNKTYTKEIYVKDRTIKDLTESEQAMIIRKHFYKDENSFNQDDKNRLQSLIKDYESKNLDRQKQEILEKNYYLTEQEVNKDEKKKKIFDELVRSINAKTEQEKKDAKEKILQKYFHKKESDLTTSEKKEFNKKVALVKEDNKEMILQKYFAKSKYDQLSEGEKKDFDKLIKDLTDSEKENLLRTYFMGKKEEELTPEEKKEFDAFKDNFKKKVIVGGAENAIAIGKYAKASKNDTIALGKDSNAVEEKAIAIGKEAKANGAQSVVIGTPNSSDNAVTDNNDNATDTNKDVTKMTAGTSSVSIGNGIKSGNYSVGIGGNVVSGDTAVAIGDRSRAIGEKSVAIGERALAKGVKSIAIGNETKANAEDSYVFGGKSEISKDATQSSAIGINISVKSSQAIAMGNDVVIEEKSRGAVAIGSDDSSYNEGNNKVNGNYTKTMAKGNATTAIGAHAQATNVAATALGARAFATEKETVAVGANSKASVEGAVAIGSYSLADQQKNTTYYNPKTGNTDGKDTDKLATKAALSIGDTSKNIRRQLIGLAAGTNDTDAVNVWQLKELKGYFDENKKFKLEGDNNREQTFELPNKLEIKGNTEKKNDTQTPQNWDDRAYTVRNIRTFISKKDKDAEVLIGMKSKPEFEGITLKTITEDKKTYIETESNVIKLTPTKDGLSLNNNKITGLANGTANSDAVNMQQLKALESTVTSNTSSIANNKKEIAKKLDVDAKNITDDGVTTLTTKLGTGKIEDNNSNLVKGGVVKTYVDNKLNDKLSSSDVDVTGDEYITVTPNKNKYALSLNKDKLGANIDISNNNAITNINTEINKKANLDASNLKEQNIKDWQAKLGNGSVADNNTGLVNGGTVKAYVDGKITDNTNTINIKLDTKLNKDDLDVTGDDKYITVTNEDKTKKKYKVTFNETNLKNLVNDTDITNNNYLKAKLDDKADKNASNLTETDITAWQAKLGNGNVASGDTKLVKGDTVFTYVNNTVNTIKQELSTKTTEDLAKKLDVDAKNITDDGVATLTTKLGTGVIEDNNKNLVTGGTVKKYITEEINTINNTVSGKLSSEDIDVKGDDYITVNKGVNKPNHYSLVFDKDKLASDLDLTKNTKLTERFNKYALLDGTNLNSIDLNVWQAKLGNGTITKDNTGLVKGGEIYNYMTTFKQELTNQSAQDLSNKLDKDGTNLDKESLDKLTNKLSEGSNLTTPTNRLVTDTKVSEALKGKLNVDADNLSENGITNLTTTLGKGEVKTGDTKLVTGGKVYEVTQELNKSISTNTENITDLNNKYTTLNKQVKTNTSDISELKTTVNGLKSTTQDITNIKTKLDDIDNSITNINTKLDDKLDKTDLSIKGKEYIKVDKDAKFNYTLSLNKDKLAKELDLTDNTSVNNMFTNKLGNIDTNISNLTTKVDNNTNSINSLKTTVNDNTNKITNLTNKVDTNTKGITTLKQDMTKKLNVDADNLTTKGETNLINKLSKGSDIANPKDRLVTDTQVNTYLSRYNDALGVVDKKSTVALEKSELALGGVANAVAMANLVQVNSYSRHRHNLSAAYGYYGGSHALAVGFSGTNEERNFVYKLSGSVNNKGNLAFGVGAGVMLGEEHDTFHSIDNKKINEVTKKLDEANKKISEYEDDKKQTAKKFKELEDKYENDKKESNKKLQEMERKLEMLMKKFK